MGILKDVQKVGGSVRQTNPLERRLAKATEELGELAEAILGVTSATNGKRKVYMDVVEEAVDVAILGLDIALTKPKDGEDMTDKEWRTIVKIMFEKKLTKWAAQIETNTTLMPTSEQKRNDQEIAKNYGFELNPNGSIKSQTFSKLTADDQLDEEIDAGLHQ